MSELNEKQADFAYHIAKLIVRAKDELGIRCVGAEWHRTPEQAKIYAEQGKGISKSNHIVKLALDIFCLDANGNVTWDHEPYAKLAALWKTMHPLARWGGDIPKLRDAVHFSFLHNGVI